MQDKKPNNEKIKKQGKSLPSGIIIRLGKFVWTTMWHLMMSNLAPRNQSGEYIRPASQFRNFIGTQVDNPYQPQAGRYRLYIGLGCPWAHRTLVVRSLKGLEDAILVSIVSPSPNEGIWVLNQEEEGCRTLPQLYNLAVPGYQGRCTVPVLWDTQTKTIVNNESAEIIVMLNSQFNEFAKNPQLDLYPEELREQIDHWNEKIYHAVNNGVYRCGFAQTQQAYDKACHELFTTLDEIDAALAKSRYLCGDRVTLADARLFTTLFRFDVVYYGLFKCDRRRIQDYENLGPYLRDLYQLPGVSDTCDLDSVKRDYYGNLFPLNPGGIIPCGPDVSYLLKPHNRQGVSG
ncbi:MULTISPECIES: glutathione S-transferase family protein [Fischerella]|uniref:Glutathione S-transferase family protein n=1 Tax=Fischerella muscicola CCMEE 5323 TaxID=2019572 RepID=A0A2N6JXD2_FISMU|nr:glutathione S-transferase family protein [Fischerella muscicola]MBD2429625.1 glutathione S-transferase family protein [Fischerella sp. FACHB-380]PLZ84865.1 glutathione S-transferase family protein [Fischerella muscicola CCMEE 5323]